MKIRSLKQNLKTQDDAINEIDSNHNGRLPVLRSENS